AADDSYAAAYAYAALWQIHNVNQGWTSNLEADSSEAARLAAAAVERDPVDGFALAVYGHTKAVLFRDYRGSMELFDRAIEAAPGNAMAWSFSSGSTPILEKRNPQSSEPKKDCDCRRSIPKHISIWYFFR